MNLFTIGFTGTNAESFFARLLESGVKTVIDVRLHNTSQLSGFAKKDDLSFFLETVAGISYKHCIEMAPEEEMLQSYRNSGDWKLYEREFLQLMKKRRIEKLFTKRDMNNSCLLCSEKLPHHCHRRVVAEYLNEKWGNLKVMHL